MAMKGMDVEQVTEYGNDLQRTHAGRLRELRNTLTGQSNGLSWEGPDADEFKNSRVPSIGQMIDRLVSDVEELGRVAVRNAQAQADVSATL